MSLVDSVRAWRRRTFTWSNSRESWHERLAGLLLLLVTLGVWRFGGERTTAQKALLGSLLLLALAVLLRRGWLKFFGPVLFYDLMRTARRSRYILIRLAYLAFLLFLLLWMYSLTFWQGSGQPRRIDEVAAFTEAFFFTFLSVQFATVALLTPAYTAGAIAEEKERKTLEFILATDLRNREIVLSKLASRLLNLLFLILAGLPILSMLQFLGGIDPDLVLAGFAATGLTMLSLASFSIFNSVLMRKARDAVFLTYLGGAAYLILSSSSYLLLLPHLGLANLPSTLGWESPVTVQDLVAWVNAGNIFAALGKLFNGGSARPYANLPVVLRDYALFHALIAILCTSWAIWRLRPIALNEAQGESSRKLRRLHLRPVPSDRPVLWREVFVESGRRGNWFSRLLVFGLMLVSFVPVAFIFQEYADQIVATRGVVRGRDPWQNLGEQMNVWVRGVGTAVACLMLLSVAVRAAGSISGEREKQTWDSLLTSPLDSDELLSGKWLGSMLSVRWSWLWWFMIWSLALISGGVHPLALPLVLVAWMIFASFLAGLGLWFSTICGSTFKATIATLFTCAGLAVGHWLIWMCCAMVNPRGAGGDDLLKYLVMFQALGLTPPITLGFLALNGKEFDNSYGGHNVGLEMLICALFGLMGWALGSLALWAATSARLREATGRLALKRPTPTPPEPVSVPPLDQEWIDEPS